MSKKIDCYFICYQEPQERRQENVAGEQKMERRQKEKKMTEEEASGKEDR